MRAQWQLMVLWVARHRGYVIGSLDSMPEKILSRLSPETVQLLEPAHITHAKPIAAMKRVVLTHDGSEGMHPRL
jgi:hypothetical protein